MPEPTPPEQTGAAVERIVREEWGHVLAILLRYVRDFELAQDMLQDAFVAALRRWPRDGVPKQPRAWLLQTARRKAIDRFRREANFEAKRPQIEALAELEQREHAEDDDGESREDGRLSLIFTCCHPALAEPARIALTLQTLGGLTTPEIARAFLVPEATMAQRLVRAKRKIKAANIPFRVPPSELWAERLDSVLSVIYFIFNEGYSATSGRTPTREDLCREAIRLGRILVDLAPREAEVIGLLALMLLHDSRRPARLDREGNLVTLEHQDRGLWNRRQAQAGQTLLRGALALGRIGPFQLQAAISAVHADAETYATTGWNEIRLLYDRLYALQPSPVIRLNAAVALSFAEGADAALGELARLEREGGLERYQPFHAARADLLRRAGRNAEAAEAYRRALELTQNASEQKFLKRRLRQLEL